MRVEGKEVVEMEVEERGEGGVFLGMEYASEMRGVRNADFVG